MAKNNIELNIGSKFDGEGFNKLNSALKTSGGNIRRVSGAVGNMLGQFEGMPGTLGKVTRAAGGLLGGLLSMGVWGLIIGAASTLVGWITKIFEEEKKSADELDRMNNAWKTAEGRAAAYARRVEEWKSKKKEADEAAKKAAEEEATALKNRQYAMEVAYKKSIEETKAKIAAEKEYDKYLMRTADLKDQINGVGSDQRAINSANREIAYAAKWGDARGVKEGKLRLQLLQKEAQDRAEEKAKREANDRKIAEMREEAAAKELEIAKKREESEKKVAEIDERLANIREEAARLEENAARARGGKTFGEWQRGERQREREQARAGVRQRNVINNANREIAQLEDEQRRFGRGFNPARAARLAKLHEFVADQDPNNNPKLKEAERLEKEKADLIANTQRDIANIARKINENT